VNPFTAGSSAREVDENVLPDWHTLPSASSKPPPRYSALGWRVIRQADTLVCFIPATPDPKRLQMARCFAPAAMPSRSDPSNVRACLAQRRGSCLHAGQDWRFRRKR